MGCMSPGCQKKKAQAKSSVRSSSYSPKGVPKVNHSSYGKPSVKIKYGVR